MTRLLIRLSILLLAASFAHAAERPNVLFLLTDDQRADTIHALGNGAIATPHLDGLVRAGFVCRNAYCMGSFATPAVCLPSRTMLLSGRSLFHIEPGANGVYDANLPRSFNAAGYVTYHHGKRGNTPLGIHKGFQINKYLANDEAERRSGQPGKEIADAAIEFLTKQTGEKPFLMYLAFANPHDPRVVNREDRAKYLDADMPLPGNYLPLHPFDNGELTVRDERLAPWPRQPDEIRRQLADYYGVITHLDREIGRVLAALREAGQYDNTIIVFSSDHGLALGSHGLMGKQSLYEHSMKSPLIFAGPGIAHGESDAFVYLYDIFPTLCELAKIDAPAAIDGKSFAGIVRGQPGQARDTVFLAYREVQRAVRQADWKLIRYPKINETQLFNLRDDPDERHNLAAADPDRAKRLMTVLEQQQRIYGDKLPLVSEHPAARDVTAEQLNRR
ncbi:MAG TPA: sulfatase-like hydrolase/transferase [Pirellulales bacterium]|nr:sulfatase-like hydrolase/transferase [Pirellulales bacterium]HVA45910.1 sulfatase-like hydrolase/transferase [Pirellulales bacterium]